MLGILCTGDELLREASSSSGDEVQKDTKTSDEGKRKRRRADVAERRTLKDKHKSK